MHYHAEVYLKELGTSIQDQIQEILDPYNEDVDEPNPKSFWDWWQVGGRWKGAHVPDYDANKDPDHQERCWLCGGTGVRPGGREQFGEEWFKETGGCNGCHGTGMATKWPTQWTPHDKDVIPVSEVPENLTCYTIVLLGKVLHEEEWNGEKFVKGKIDGKTIKEVLKENDITDGYLVTVDYHC